MTKEEALTLALKALEHSHANEPIWKTPHREAITAIKEALAQPEQEPVAWLTDDERKAFERFNETCEDGEGYDVPKTMMKRLAEIGVIHHTSRGIYGITKFGRSLVGDTTPPQREVEHAMRLYKAVERLSLQAGEETEETIDWLCGEHGGMFKLFQAYFSSKFWANPEKFKKTNRENWFKFRNRLSNELWGIGLAKTSFALELCYPDSCKAVCLDVHMLRLLGMNEQGYKKDSKKDVAEYEQGERKWHYRANKMSAPNYIARCIYWDVKQGHKNSRYWSSCLENQLHFDF